MNFLDSSIMFICCDISNKECLDKSEPYVLQCRQAELPIVLLFSKLDVKIDIDPEDIEKFKRRNNITSVIYFTMSYKISKIYLEFIELIKKYQAQKR